MPTCPVFTRAKIKSRFGILVNFASHDANKIIRISVFPTRQESLGLPKIQVFRTSKFFFLLPVIHFVSGSQISVCSNIMTALCLFIYTYNVNAYWNTLTHTYTHTYLYIYICVCVCVCVCVCEINYYNECCTKYCVAFRKIFRLWLWIQASIPLI